MDSKDYVKFMTQKYATGIAIAVIKTKPKHITFENYLEMLRNSIESDINIDINLCSDDFDFDEDISNLDDNDINAQTEDLTQISINKEENTATDLSISILKNTKANEIANIKNKEEGTQKTKENIQINNKEQTSENNNQNSGNDSVDLQKQIYYADILLNIASTCNKINQIKAADSQATILYDYDKVIKKTKISTNITDILGISYVDTEVMNKQNVVPDTQSSVTAKNVEVHKNNMVSTQIPITQDILTNIQSVINNTPNSSINKNVTDTNNSATTQKTNPNKTIQLPNKEINTQNELSDIQNEIETQITETYMQDKEIYTQTTTKDNKSQSQEIDTQYQGRESQNAITNYNQEIITLDKEMCTKEATVYQYHVTESQSLLKNKDNELITIQSKQFTQNEAMDAQYELNESTNNNQAIEYEEMDTQYQATEPVTEAMDTQCQATEPVTEAIDTQSLLDYSQTFTHVSQSQDDDEQFEILEQYILGKSKTKVCPIIPNVEKAIIKPIETNNDEVPFNILDKLNKIKSEIRRHEGCSFDSGYRSDSQSQKFSFSVLDTEKSLYRAGECLFSYVIECSINQNTDYLLEEVSTAFGEYIDKLHAEEKYPPFLETVLEKINILLQNIFNSNSCGADALLTKSNAFTRLLLINYSQNLLTYTIEKLINYIEDIYQKLMNKETNFELENTNLVENLSYVFNLLEVLLKRYIKKKDEKPTKITEPISNTITNIWRQKWDPDFSKKPIEIESKTCISVRCREILKKIILDCMQDFGLICYAALQCFNCIQD